MTATSSKFLMTRIGELLISGSGQSPYTIPAGHFDNQVWYEGFEDESDLQPALLEKPQVKIELINVYDTNAWFKPSNQIMYYVEFEIGIAYNTGEKTLRQVRQALQGTIFDDIHLINKTLTNPSNLKQTDNGAAIGLAGDTLQLIPGSIDLRWNREASVVAGGLGFSGYLVLSSSP